MEWALFRGWALINSLDFQGGRLFEVGAYSKVGGESDKYGNPLGTFRTFELLKIGLFIFPRR